MKLYVGNLAYGVTPDDLNAIFSAFGVVESVSIIVDPISGESKGFAFVEIVNDDHARDAIEALNDQPLHGRAVRVNEARPRAPRAGATR